MATSNATLKCSWKTGIIYTVIIAVIAAAVIWVGLNNAMPYELTVYTADDDPISVLFTDDFYNSSMRLMMVSVIFPVAAYLLMYWRYTVLVGKYPYRKEEVKKGRLGKPWVLPLILQLALMLVWGVVSWTMISLGLGAGCDALCRCHHAQTVCSRLCDRDGAGHGAADIGPAVF